MASINVRVKRLDFAFWNGGLIGMGGEKTDLIYYPPNLKKGP